MTDLILQPNTFLILSSIIETSFTNTNADKKNKTEMTTTINENELIRALYKM